MSPYRSPPPSPPLSTTKRPYEGVLAVVLFGWFAIVGNEPSGSRLSLMGLVLLLLPVLVFFAVTGYSARK
jgi:hypothetical protein